MDLSNEDIKLLKKQSDATLAEWWSRLNSFDWPTEIQSPPEDPHNDTSRRGWKIMCWIYDKIGEKECLRYWNRERMPGKEFDEWYDNINKNPPLK